MIRKDKIEELKQIVEELKAVEFMEKNINTENKFIKSKAFNCRLNNGIIIPREQLIKGNKDGSAAIIMPITTNDEILTVIEPRVFTKLTVGVGFPAGYIENGEDPNIAALRELVEETGYVTNKPLYFVDSFYQDEGCSKAFNHLFIALNCEKKFNQKLDENEIVKYMTFKYEELFELERLGYISGCNSKLLLEKSKVYMKGR